MRKISKDKYKRALQTISNYEDQIEREKLGDNIVRLTVGELSTLHYNAVCYHFARKGISPNQITWNHLSKLTKRDILKFAGLGITGFNKINDLLKEHGFGKFQFGYPK